MGFSGIGKAANRRLSKLATLRHRAVSEQLETRRLLSSIAWKGGTGDWSNASDWYGGVVPTAADSVSINGVGDMVNITTSDHAGTVSTQPGAGINFAGGTLDIAGGSSMAGVLTGTGGNLNIESSLSFSGYGSLDGTAFTGPGNFNNSGVLQLTGDSISASITNSLSMSVSGGTTLSMGATITNATGGTFEITDMTGLAANGQGSGAAPVLINSGTLDQSGGSGTSVLNGIQLQNLGGVIEVDSGTLSDQSNAVFQNSTFNISSGAMFTLGANAGTNTFDFSGTNTGNGGGNLLFNSGTAVAQTPDGSAPASSIFDFPIGFAQVTGTSFGTGNTGAEITNTNYLDFTGSAAHGNLGLINQGNLNVAGSGNLGVGAGGSFTNGHNGTILFETDAGVASLGGSPVFTNMGTIEKAVGSGTTVFGIGTGPIGFSNVGGSFAIASGNISIHNGGSGNVAFTAGSISISSGSTLNFDLGTGTIDSSGSFTSTGGGSVTFTSGTWQGPSTALGQNGGTGTLNFTPGTFLDSGGAFNDPQNVINTGYIDYQNATAFGGFLNKGVVLVADGETLAMTTNFVNNLSALIIFTGSATVSGFTLTNDGTILKSAGTGTVDLTAVGFTNAGTVQVSSGTIALPASASAVPVGASLFASAGAAITLSNAQTITTNDGTITLGGAGASIPALSGLTTNAGTLNVDSGASFATAGPLTNTGIITVGGDLTVTGNLTESGTPTLAFSIAADTGTAGAPDLVVTGSAALAGNLTAALVGAFSPGPGVAYTAATFGTAATGSFASTTGVGPNFSATVNPTSIVLTTTSSAPPNPTLGLSPTITKSTVPTAIVSGVKTSGAVTISATNTTAGVDKGLNIIKLYASTNGMIDSNSTFITMLTRKLNVKAGKGTTLRVSFRSLVLPAGTYTLLAQITDPAGIALASTTGPLLTVAAPFVTLSETLTTTLPSPLVSGTTARGSVKLLITNHGNVASKGLTSINITASTATGVLGTSIGMVTRKLNIPAGKSVTVVVPIKSTPSLATNSYFLVAQVTDPFAGGTSLASSAAPISIEMPVITLSAVLGPVTNPKSGDTITINNSGNIADISKFTGTLGFSTNPDGTQPVGGTAVVTTSTLTIRPGKNAKVHLTGWKGLLAGLNSGATYYLTATLTDAAGHNVTAVSTTAFTL